MPESDKTAEDALPIALEVMGGDHAPSAQVEGARLALLNGIGPITLVGQTDEVREELKRRRIPPETFPIVHAAETVTMDESPTYALRRKKDASIAVATRLVRDQKACALVSCGSTGAQVASSILHLGRLPGVERPAIAVAFPGTHGWGVLIDAGANAQNRPSHLVGFAVMGSLYLRHIFEVENPRVGLVSIGEEAARGNDLVVESHKLLQRTPGINFIGMVEGRGVYTGGADVLVCDGFVG
ncbi:phosphate acyltransferase, partial [bacterium]|nr:phosphate acyltransferase [bacterium]